MSVEDPTPALTEREEQIRRLLRIYEQQLRQSLPTGPQTLEQIERNARDIGEAVKKDVQKEVADAQGRGYAGKQVHCGCGKPARYLTDYARQVVTLHGVLVVRRAYYYCRTCKAGFCPLDTRLQLPAGVCSVLVSALLARFAAFLSFAQAAREVEAVCGLHLSVSTVRRQAQLVGQEVQRQWTQEEAALWQCPDKEVSARPKQLQLTCDGVMVHVGGVWREAKIGCAYQKADQGGTAAEGGVRQAAYYATVQNSQAFGKRLRTLAHLQGADNCRQVGIVADGAEWIWQEAGKYFPTRVQILDYYHACEHLWQVAHARYGEGAEAAAWMERQHARLRANEVGWVLREVEQWKADTAGQKEVQRKVSQYLRTHTKRMRYQTFAEAGYHIGSGIAEASCKNVIQARFKQAGMRWKEPGAEAMLHLRAAWCSSQQADLVAAARTANRLV